MWCADRCGALCESHDANRHVAASVKAHERMAIGEKSTYLQQKLATKVQLLKDRLRPAEAAVRGWMATVTNYRAREAAIKSQLHSG
jgi:hypothetical protein